MKIIKSNLVVLLGFSLFLSGGCDDGSNTPESSSISGIVTFSASTFPTTEGSYVAISLQSLWPPIDAPYAFAIILEGDIVQDNKYSFTFDNVAFGTYEAIAVSWENPDPTYNSSCNQSTLGAYGGSASNYFMTPVSITTSTTAFVLTGIDMDANISLAVPNPYSICQTDCADETTEVDCTAENMGHCLWDANTGCGYK